MQGAPQTLWRNKGIMTDKQAEARPWGDHQFSIYLDGTEGRNPVLPMGYGAMARAARKLLDPRAYWYVAGGAGIEAMRANREALRRWAIVPRMLRDCSARRYACTIFGQRFAAPVLLAPVGVQGMLHPHGELATARAAATLGLPLITSLVSSHSLEDVAAQMDISPRWFQLYWPRDWELTASLIQRAERAGYTALVVTLDTRTIGWRDKDLARGFLPFLKGQGLANYTSDPVFQQRLGGGGTAAVPLVWASLYSDLAHTWQDVARLRQLTKLPLLFKGIMHPDDARMAVDCGVDGLIISNHGGRQVNGAMASLDALVMVRSALGDAVPLLFDSGIRHGAEVVKALALGAQAVLLSRPYLWGLALAGEAGVAEVCRRFLAEFDLTMVLAGLRGLDDLQEGILQHRVVRCMACGP